MPGPIRPEDVTVEIPDRVFDAVNELIRSKFDGKRAVLQLGEVESAIGSPCPRYWLNFEKAYEAVGWQVKYEQPAFNESGPAFYTFTKKDK